MARVVQVESDVLNKPAIGDFVKGVDKALQAQFDKKFGRKNRCKRLIIASLTLTSVAQECYGSHCGNFYQFGKHHPDWDVTFITPRRMAIDDMRNMAVQMAIKGGFRFLWFFDDDTVMSWDVLGRLLAHMDEFNAVSSGYYVRGYPFNPMVFRWVDPEKPEKGMRIYDWRVYKKHVDKDGVLRKNVAALGNGCTLYRVKDFEKIPYPWFKTGPTHTEDTWFFARAKQYIPDYKAGMDFKIDCGHLLLPLYVDSNNVDVMRRFYRQLYKVGGLSQ